MNQRWEETHRNETQKFKDQIADLKKINGGIRLDIMKDDTNGKYQITEATESEEGYDLSGKLFEFTKLSEGSVLYQFVQMTKADVCAGPLIVEEEVEEPVEEFDEDEDEAYYQGTNDDYEYQAP
jgi:hypothetical protein